MSQSHFGRPLRHGWDPKAALGQPVPSVRFTPRYGRWRGELIRHFRRVSTRYDRLAHSDLAFASLACAFGPLVKMQTVDPDSLWSTARQSRHAGISAKGKAIPSAKSMPAHRGISVRLGEGNTQPALATGQSQPR